MNSRDAAAYGEMMALLVDHSATEMVAAGDAESPPSPANGSVNGLGDGDEQVSSPVTAKKKRKRGSEDASVGVTSFVLWIGWLNCFLFVAPQLNALDLRRRPRIVPLSPNLRRCRKRRRQRPLPSLSQCLRRLSRLRRATHRGIDEGVPGVVGPPPRGKR